MLREEIVTDAEKGDFNIYPVATVDEAIELTLTGELTMAKELMLAYAGDNEQA